MVNYFALGCGVHAIGAAGFSLLFPQLAFQLFFQPQYANIAVNDPFVQWLFAGVNVVVLGAGCGYASAAVFRGQRSIYIAGCMGKVLVALLFLLGLRAGYITRFAMAVGVSDLILGILMAKKALASRS